jgi:hypothetical protein
VFQYIARLSWYLQRWVELSGTAKTYNALHDLMIREQYLNTCDAELHVAIFIREPVLKNLEEMTKLAEQYTDAHSIGQQSSDDQPSIKAAFAQSFNQNNFQNMKTCKLGTNTQISVEERKCFICHRRNHNSSIVSVHV